MLHANVYACSASEAKPTAESSSTQPDNELTRRTKMSAGLPALSDSQKPLTPSIDADLTEEQRQMRLLELINQISKVLVDPLLASDIQTAVTSVLEYHNLKELFNFDIAEVCLWDEETQTLTTSVRVPRENAEVQDYSHTYRANEGFTGWIAANQQSLLIPDIYEDKKITPKAGLSNFPYKAYIGTPLKHGSKFIGTLELASLGKDNFSLQDVTLLEIVANQLAVVIENIWLYNLTDRELQRRVDELAGLQRVSNELNSTLDLSKILGMVLEEATHLTHADFANVYFYDAATGNLVAYIDPLWHGELQAVGQNGTDDPPAISPQDGIIGRSLRTGESILVPDVRDDADDDNVDANLGSKVVVPINFGGEPIGVINLESRQRGFFNTNQLHYLEALASHAGVAIGNAQAYRQQRLEREQAGRRADLLSRLSEISNAFRTNRPLTEVLEDIAFAIAESVGYDVVLISLVQGSPPTIQPQVGAGIPLVQLKELQEPAQIKALANLDDIMLPEFNISNSYFIPANKMSIWQDKLNVPYIEKFQQPPDKQRQQTDIPALSGITIEKQRWQTGDLLLMPLRDIEGKVIGLLTVANPVDDYRPDFNSIQTLETFANHAAAAIENAQLFELEQQRRQLADTLRGVAEAISSHLEFDDLLNIILRELSRVISYDSANVQLWEEDKLIIIGGHGWPDSQKVIGLTFPMSGHNPNRLVIETQEPVIVKDVQQEFPDSFSGPVHSYIRSWLGVPLTYGTNILGVMALDKNEVDFFTQDDVNVIVAFANQVAVALQNAHLFDEARRQVRQLAALTEVSQSINRALELNEVLDLVLEAVFDLVGHSKGSIWLIDSDTKTVKMADTKNIPDFLVELFNESDIPITSEPFASVIESGEVQIIAGSTEKDNIANYGLPFPDDVTYVPLSTETGVIGILAIEVVISSNNMLDLVTTLADLAAVAIDNARLLQDTRRRATEMQSLYNLGVEVSGLLDVQEVMQSVTSSTLALTESQLGGILLQDEQHPTRFAVAHTAATIELRAQFDLNHTGRFVTKSTENRLISLWFDLVEEILETGQPVNVNFSYRKSSVTKSGSYRRSILADDLGVRAILGVPVYAQNQVNGAIFVVALRPRNYNERDVQSLSFVANQAAVAVQNAQLVQRLNQLTEELEQRVALRTEELARTLQDLTEERDRVGTLYQIARELSTSFDLDRVLNEALNLINRAIGISHGSILLVDNESEFLAYRAALGRIKPLPRGGLKTSYKSGYGLAGRVMENREPRLVANLANDPDWIPSTKNDERCSAVAVPLSTGDDVLGVLMLFHPDPDYFTEDHLKLVTAASAQIGTAVNNAMLYRLITDQAKRLGILYRKQATEAAKNEAILKGITDGVLVLDANLDIMLMNPKAAEILNLNAAEVEGEQLHQILGRSESPLELELTQEIYDKLLPALDEISAGQISAQFRVEVGPKAVSVSLAPVSLAAEDLPSVVAVLRDISKEAEIERLKNEFISTVSHELRTPMTSIKGYSDLLLSGNDKIGQLNQTQHRFVSVIQSNANRLTELVNDILEISRIETGRIKLDFATLNIIDVIKEVAVSFEGQLVKKVMNLTLHLPEAIPDIYADKARLTQVLVNLIGNAWQYTPEGGHIDVYAKQVGSFVQIDVADTGIGIPEKDVEYVFDRFFRSERTEVQVVDGTGLGLSITRSFVEMLGGKIWLKSQLDVGTTFSFTVPLYNSEDAIIIDGLGASVGPEILIVDDDKTVTQALKVALEDQGYQVAVLTSSQDALNVVRSARETLKMILVDAALQDGSSFLILRQLSQDESMKEISVWLSSLSMGTDMEQLHVQIVGYVTPSTEEHQILTTIEHTVDNQSEVDTDPAYSRSRPFTHRIIIAEQNREVSQRLKDILTTSGFDVHCAYNNQQALDMVVGNRPDIIFANSHMTDGNGESILYQLVHTSSVKHVPIIMITDEAVLSSEDTNIKILDQMFWSNDHRPLTVEAVVSGLLLEKAAHDERIRSKDSLND